MYDPYNPGTPLGTPPPPPPSTRQVWSRSLTLVAIILAVLTIVVVLVARSQDSDNGEPRQTTLALCERMANTLNIDRDLDSGNEMYYLNLVICQADIGSYNRCLSLAQDEVAILNGDLKGDDAKANTELRKCRTG